MQEKFDNILLQFILDFSCPKHEGEEPCYMFYQIGIRESYRHTQLIKIEIKLDRYIKIVFTFYKLPPIFYGALPDHRCLKRFPPRTINGYFFSFLPFLSRYTW